MNKAVDWEHIQSLVGDVEVERSRLALNQEKEFWFDAAPGGLEMGVWRDGRLVPEVWPKVVGRPPVNRREFVWNRDREIFVDIEVRHELATVRRGHLNSTVLHCSSLPATEVNALLHDYRQWGFLSGSPWHTDVREVVRRSYRGDTIVTVWLDATNVAVHQPQTAQLDVMECETREEAIQTIETHIDDLESRRGFTLGRVEVLPSACDNPPVAMQGGITTSILDDLPPAPEDAKDAVDAAIALLHAVCGRYPGGHLVVEMEWDDAPRIPTLEEDEGFSAMHAERFGRWQTRRMCRDPLLLAGKTSSFDYFAERYGSISWLITRSAELPRFHEGFAFDNTSGSGHALMQIDANGTYCVAPEELPEALRHYLVFAGGWASAQGGFALDRRVPDEHGEYSIVTYDESEPPSDDTPPVPAASFGHWLLTHVTEMIRAVEPTLRRIQ